MKNGVYFYFGGDYLTNGSFDDLHRLGIKPEEGMRLTFYEIDVDEQNRPIYLCAEGILHAHENGRNWLVEIDKSSVRSVLRADVDD
jgi:hypothetical protein